MSSSDGTTKEQAASVRAVGHVQPGLLLTFVNGTPAFQVTPISSERVVIGRGSASSLVVQDERLSRQHAAISRDVAGWRVEDLGSRNGTYVNGRRLEAPWIGPMPRSIRVGQAVLLPFEDIAPLVHPHRLFDRDAVLGPRTQAAHDVIGDAARLGHNVLVIGETGVGKELAAGAFHRASGRNGPFRALNCAAVADHLLESELFGHARGAFSGAAQAHAGLFESAQGGTVFLDELGEMPAPMQAKLLRTIQEKEVRRVGENEVRHIDVRLVAATNRDLAEHVRNGHFRQDLYYRFAHCVVHLLPLRDRTEEIAYLVAHALRERDADLVVDSSFVDHCIQRSWPGNVRELLSTVQVAASAARRAKVTTLSWSHLPAPGSEVRPPPSGPVSPQAALDTPATRANEPSTPRAAARQQREDEILAAFQRDPSANAASVAALLGVSVATVYRALERRGKRPG